MKIQNVSQTNSILSIYLNEIRDREVQKDRLRFRKNLERIAMLLAYEASKSMDYHPAKVQTPLGIDDSVSLVDQVVVCSILRAGLPMHQGVLDVFDRAENAFVGAYRQHHKSGNFDIKTEYFSCPSLDGKVLLICDPMIASGQSIVQTIQNLQKFGTPKSIIVMGIIASAEGIQYVCDHFPNVQIIVADEDSELTAKGYIVPGLGDAGDLAYGDKINL
jgi:uracil phosphoribosyltransferase